MLRSLWGKGRSATEVATAINERFGRQRTRSAVIGYVHRLGLMRRGRGASNPVRVQKARKPVPRAQERPSVSLPASKAMKAGATTVAKKRAQDAREAAQKTSASSGSPKQQFPEVVTRTRFLTPVPESNQLDVMQLTDHTCRHASTERAPHSFCGHKTVPGKHWCPAHYERVYRHPEAIDV